MPTRRPSAKPVQASSGVQVFMNALVHPHKSAIEVLRQAILAADPNITEEIKWNAPSFRLQDHFLTFRLRPPKNLQLIFHVGTKPVVPARKFSLDLPASSVKWAAPDRCVLTISDPQAAEEMAPQVALAVQQWLAQLGSRPEPAAPGPNGRA